MKTEKASPKSSLIKESQHKKASGKLKILISFLITIGLFGSGYSYISQQTETTKKVSPPQLITVTQSDLKTSIESDGQIINPNIVNLSFLVNGTLDSIAVEEGDRVKKGDFLAKLDQRDFLFDLRTAQSNVEVNQANIRAKEAELTDLELKSIQKDIEVSELDLDTTKKDLAQKVTQSFDSGIIALETSFLEIENTLQIINGILAVDDSLHDNFSRSFNNQILENSAENDYKSIRNNFAILQQEYHNDKAKNLEQERLAVNLWKTKSIAENVQALLDDMTTLFKTARANAVTTQSEIDNAKNNLNSYKSKMSSEIKSLTSAKQAIETALLNQQNRTFESENAINKLQLKLENEEQNYEKKEITKDSNLAIQYAQLNQSKIKVEQAQYNLSLTTLNAPIDGEVIQINGNEGETIKTESTNSDNAFIKILSDANFTIEVYVEEVDIANVQKGQKVYITLDAIEDLEMEGEVTFISSIATTNNNGIVTYLVRIDITDRKEASIKEGMTAYTEFVLGEKKDIPTIPLSVIQKRGSKQFVFLEDQTKTEITTGFSDGTNVEVLTGLNIGDKIWSDDPTGNTNERQGQNRADNGNTPKEVTPEMQKRMEEAGLTAEEIQKMQNGELTDEMREKMKAYREKNGGGFGGRGGRR